MGPDRNEMSGQRVVTQTWREKSTRKGRALARQAYAGQGCTEGEERPGPDSEAEEANTSTPAGEQQARSDMQLNRDGMEEVQTE